jgi:hypothetical protein
MTRRRPEQQLQRAVLDHLRWRGAPGLWWCHYPAGGFRSAIEAAIFKSLGTAAGVPDLLLVHRGQLYGLELKGARGGRPSDAQIATHEAMRRAGAVVGTAWGLDHALALLATWGLLRPDVSNQIANTFTELRDDVARRAARGRRQTAEQPKQQER